MGVIRNSFRPDLEQRIKALEDKVYGKKKSTTLYQQILLLDYLGMLDIIRQLDTSNVKKAELLGKIINRDFSSVKKAIENLGHEDSDLMTPLNLEFVLECFQAAKINDKRIDLVNKDLKESSKYLIRPDNDE